MRSMVAALADLVASLLVAGTLAVTVLALSADRECRGLPPASPLHSPRPAMPSHPREAPPAQPEPKGRAVV